jgi:hypothetical protein
MWPRIALWVVGFLAVPVAKHVWNKILEAPSYWKDMERVNAEHAAEEKKDKELLEKFKKSMVDSLSGRPGKTSQRREILFRDFRDVKNERL